MRGRGKQSAKGKEKVCAVRGFPSDQRASLRSSKIHSSGCSSLTGYHLVQLRARRSRLWRDGPPPDLRKGNGYVVSKTPLTICGSDLGFPLFPMMRIPLRKPLPRCCATRMTKGSRRRDGQGASQGSRNLVNPRSAELPEMEEKDMFNSRKGKWNRSAR